MPEGDTIAYAANRIRPVLLGQVPDEILTPQPRHAGDGWPERLRGRTVRGVDTHGKHLFIRFDGEFVLHSHLGMVGSWVVHGAQRPPGWRAWIVLRVGERLVIERDGPTLELLTAARARFDRRLSQLGPDILAPDGFDRDRFLVRLRGDDPTRAIGDALLDQRNVAGIGNIWKAEGCWEAGIDPWRPVGTVPNEQAIAIVETARARMLRSAEEGPGAIGARVYKRRSCPRCGGPIRVGSQGDANRTTYWCPGCQH